MIYYLRAAHPDESVANEIAKKSLLLCVSQKNFMRSPLKNKKKNPFKLFS